MLSSPELMSSDTPCKLRKHSWYGACSSVSSSISPGPISYALLHHTPPARTENKSQSTGLVELATWFQKWAVKVKATRPKETKSEHLDDLHDQSVHSFFWNHKFEKELCIDIFRIYFRSP